MSENMNQRLMLPMQTPQENPRLEFRDGQHLLRIVNVEGGIVERFISNAAVREAFSGIPIDSGWIRPEIARWGDGRHGEWAVAFMPPALYELEITSEAATTVEGEGSDVTKPFTLDRIKAPLPGLVLFGMGTQYYLWAVKTQKLEPYHEIYRAPLPNVYASGAICWGLVKPPRMTARTLFDAWSLFITSTFNNHLASGKSKNQRDDVRVVLRELAGDEAKLPLDYSASSHFRSSYPVEDLVRQVEHVGVTLDNAIKQFFEIGEMPEV